MSSVPNVKPRAILDCGCGTGKWGSILRCHRTEMREVYIVGVDVFLPNVEYSKKYGAYDDLILADAKMLPFKNNCFDLILACEIIEHMEKEQGMNFVDELERICSGRIIITTPNMHFHNPIEYENQQKNKWEFHRSKWTVKDFQSKGYIVRGIGIRWMCATQGLLGEIVAALDFLLFPAWFLPRLGKFLVAYKDAHEFYFSKR